MSDKRSRLLLLFALFWLARPLVAQSISADSKSSLIPEITIIGSSDRMQTTDISPGASAAPTPDSMDIIKRMPGANVNRNGPLSGQAQYRGLAGPRMNVLVDSMRVTPGGLNWMDSPMHYMPPGLTKKVTMTRGIASVSSGTGIGGLIEAQSKQSEFTSDHEFSPQGDFVASAMSNDGGALSGVLGTGNVNHRFHVLGSYEDGDDTEFGGGTIGATQYERQTYGGGYGFRWKTSDLGIAFTHTDTDLTGTPALPMDIDFFDTDRLNAHLNTNWGGVGISARIFYTGISHGMNNFLLREPQNISDLPLPPFADEERRFVDVESDALGFSAQAEFNVFTGNLIVGVDGNFEEHSGLVKDPDFDPFFVENFNKAAQDRLGVFTEWFGKLSDSFDLELGIRYTRTESDSDSIDAFPARLAEDDMGNCPPPGMGMVPGAICRLRNSFNDADRDLADNDVDAVVKLDYEITDDLSVGIGYAHKSRAASYIERYLWIPLEINSGLGDLNNYVGNLNLDSEISDQIELSLEWKFERGFFAPRIFYRSVDDFIQGVAATDPDVILVSGAANGDPTPMQFINTDATLYGLDAVFRYELVRSVILDATFNYVRGENDSLNDDLYRIAPLNGRIALTYDRDAWSVTVESVLAAEQDKISRTIVLDEPRSSNDSTAGYGVVNLYGQWSSGNGFHIRAGVENIFDKDYTNHLAGFNRVTPSDVALGVRLPGSGVNVFAQIAYVWR
jgi:iron complex outermembrane receptor protein